MTPTTLLQGLFFVTTIFVYLLPLSTTANTDCKKCEYRLEYSVEILPKEKKAHVVISIPKAKLISEIDFNIKKKWHENIQANGVLEIKDGRAIWQPPKKKAKLSLDVNLMHQRDSGEYDSYITEDWAIFRGDDLIPSARVKSQPGAYAKATLEFKLPNTWPSVNTGWGKAESGVLRIDNPERRFDRPTGWMIAGKLGTRRDILGQANPTRVSVSAPKGSILHRMEVLALLNVVWPEAEKVFEPKLSELLIVGAGDPMWRGGLSSPNSFYLHEERPLISENGTSSLIHELGHVLSGIIGKKGDDWIAEGLIEFYAVELLYRAGAMTDERRNKVFEDLAQWGKKVKTLRAKHSTGKRTARAAVLFKELDEELRKHSQYSIDDITKALMQKDKVSRDDLITYCQELKGKACRVLNSKLIR